MSKEKREYDKNYYLKNKEKIKERNRKWYANNLKKATEYRKKYYLENKEKFKERSKKWKANNPEKKAQIDRKWRANNPGYTKEWRAANREYEIRQNRERHFGSNERYEEAMLKYDGWCAFACDRKAELVHHLDGKSIHTSPIKEVNNSLSNLLPLCVSCHMKLHKYKRKEINNAIQMFHYSYT